MQTIRSTAGTAAALAGLCLLALPGCAGLRAKATGLAGHDDPTKPPVAKAARPQNDAIGRPVPGSPAPPTVERPEQPPELTSETRAHVALAMGQMLEGAGKLGDAQVHYEQALKLDPKSLKATLALARVYSQLGRPDAALKLYETAEKQHHKDPALYNDKGLHLAEQKDWPGAIEALRKAVKLDRSNSKYHNNLGMVLAVSGAYDEAWKEFREAVGPGPAHYNVALMLTRAGRTAQARDHLERALAIMPTLKEAEPLLAQINAKAPDAARQTEPARREPELDLNLKTISQEERADDEPRVLPAVSVRLCPPVGLEDESTDLVTQTAPAAGESRFWSVAAANEILAGSMHDDGDPWLKPRVAGKWLR